jgi:hypothetical protein
LRGEFVRNELEMKVADSLFKRGIVYEYEPYMKVGKNAYFPDFKIGNMIIECTAWNGEDKAIELKEKMQNYARFNLKSFCIIDENVIKFYKDIREFIIDIKDIPFHAQVAQISQV